jgi:hypothetical protein
MGQREDRAVNFSPLAALRLAIAGPRYVRPTAADRARHSGDSLALPPRARDARREPRPAAQWFAELEEHFPRAYLHACASDLDQLRAVSGCTPAEAASYARIYLNAPAIVAASGDGLPDLASPVD